MVYDFNYRKGYGSQNYLIEINNINDDKTFLEYFFRAINTISPTIIGIKDIWMNDEILMEVNTECGKINVHIDVWGFAFIMSNENCIKKIYELLTLDNNFNNATNELINILHETIFYLKKSNDSIYSNESVEEIKNIIGELITKIRNNNDVDKNKLMLLFAQTGNLQNISINNGWKNEFLEIVENMDKLLKNILV